MIRIKHFKTDRADAPPDWKEAEKFLNSTTVTGFRPKVVAITAYPTGPSHNLVVVYDDSAQDSGTSTPEA